MEQKIEKQFKGSRPLVLIVDNDPDNLLFVSCVVESLGMRYAVTNDSEKCLDLVEELSPNLMLLDIVMPVVDGLEITRVIKNNLTTTDIPIIAVTGLTRLEDKHKIFEAGCNDYLAKPYLIEELESKIYSYIKPA